MYYKTILPDDSLIVLGDLKPFYPATLEWQTDMGELPDNDSLVLVQGKSTHGELYAPEVMRANNARWFKEIVRFAIINTEVQP